MPLKSSPCLKRLELPLNEQIFNTIGITPQVNIQPSNLAPVNELPT